MLMKPTTMLFRNLMAMDVEECIRAYPLDGVVLLCGCDKTTPAQLMGAASADVPAIMVPGGPMLRGMWHGTELGSGTDVRRFWEEVRAGRLSEEEWCEIESCVSRSAGHCTVMGTASTMASLAEALGMTLPGAADIPPWTRAAWPSPSRAGDAWWKWWGKTFVPPNFDPCRPRECHPPAHGPGRLHECHHPPGGHRRTVGHRSAAFEI